MDPVFMDLRPRSDDDRFLSLTYEERWSKLKKVIVQLYMRKTLDQVVEFMRTHYSFHAAPTEYRRRFKDWGVTKRMTTKYKDDTTSTLVKRKHPGASVSDVTTKHDDKYEPIDFKKLKRHLISRKACLDIAPGLLSSWNLPYKAFISSLPRDPEGRSPFGPIGPTPDNLQIQAPEALTPGRAAAGPSPRIQLIYEKHKEHCTSLFLQGRLRDLLISLPKEGRSTMVNYFHDFYMHSFILAKNWGKDIPHQAQTHVLGLTPQTWNANSPWTPSAFLNFSSGPSSPEGSSAMDISLPPMQLCKWSIHVSSISCQIDRHMETVAPPARSESSSFVNCLHQSMLSNDFTTTPKGDLPLAHDLITRSLEEHPSPLQLDAWRLAIMAGNMDLLYQLWEDNEEEPPEGIEALHPFHLAAAFLNGGKRCCEVFFELSRVLGSSFAFHHNVDDLGDTILDGIVVAVLRSHTSIEPGDVRDEFHLPNRFPGEENDICGRWDSETPAVRELFKQGYARIPTKWKHPFCHTAVQAVCHSITTIFASPASPNINTQSGLFVRRCTACGLELRLRPLHTIVVTAFYLAQMGRPGETLFGALAMMICLITLGADVSMKANISVEEILRSSNTGQCRHTQLSPLDLIQAVPGDVIKAWSESCRVGWGCLADVLAVAMLQQNQERSGHPHGPASPLGDEWPDTPTSSFSESSDHSPCWEDFQYEYHINWLKLPCNGPRIGLLWASIQTELLTYRRVREGDAWISESFSMKALKTWLKEEDTELSMPLVQNSMFKMHTPCGWFGESSDFLCPTAEEVCTKYFMNMDIYSRSSFIVQPDLLGSFESLEPVEQEKVSSDA